MQLYSHDRPEASPTGSLKPMELSLGAGTSPGARIEQIRRILLIGPPGAGKGTQGALLAHKLGVPHIISSGILDQLRDKPENDAERALSIEIEGYRARGELVPDPIICNAVIARILKADCANGFILDGYPRTLNQALVLRDRLQALGTYITDAVLLDISDERAAERVQGRKESGVVRSDDSQEVVRRRLDKFRHESAAFLPLYEQMGILHRIPADNSIQEVTSQICAVLQLRSTPNSYPSGPVSH